MKIRKLLSVTVLFVFSATIAHAQYIKYKDAVQFKDRQPVVMINPPNDNLVSKLTKKGWLDALQVYQKAIADYNTAMKDAVTKFWTYNTMPILVKTKEEVIEMCKDKSTRDNLIIFYVYSELSLKHDFDWGVDEGGKQLVGSRSKLAMAFKIHDNQVYEVNMQVLIPTAGILDEYFANAATTINGVLSKAK